MDDYDPQKRRKIHIPSLSPEKSIVKQPIILDYQGPVKQPRTFGRIHSAWNLSIVKH